MHDTKESASAKRERGFNLRLRIPSLETFNRYSLYFQQVTCSSELVHSTEPFLTNSSVTDTSF